MSARNASARFLSLKGGEGISVSAISSRTNRSWSLWMNAAAFLNSGLSRIRRTDAFGVCAAAGKAVSRSAHAALSAIFMQQILLPGGRRLLRERFKRARRVAEELRLTGDRFG